MYTKHGPEAEFKEFEPRFKFKPLLNYGWFYLRFKPPLNLNRVLADLSRDLNSLNSTSDLLDSNVLCCCCIQEPSSIIGSRNIYCIIQVHSPGFNNSIKN